MGEQMVKVPSPGGGLHMKEEPVDEVFQCCPEKESENKNSSGFKERVAILKTCEEAPSDHIGKIYHQAYLDNDSKKSDWKILICGDPVALCTQS